MQSYNDCVNWLNSMGFSDIFSQRKVHGILSKIKALNKDCKVITVAGTNGKGSTCYLLEHCLLSAGYRVATFISPHFIEPYERIRIMGKSISEEAFMAACQRLQDLDLADEPAWFETVFLLAYIVFAQEEIDYLVLEVGLGGRLDPTNCVEPDISLVTTIDLDHQSVLGDTREEIALEKAGIFRAHKPAICGDPNPPNSLLEYASEIESKLLIQNKDFEYSKAKEHWSWRGLGKHYDDLPLPHLPLQNASTALTALTLCGLSEEVIHKGLRECRVPGRFQIIANSPQVICDVTHNPQASRYLNQQLEQQPCKGASYAVVAMNTSKDITNSLVPLLSKIDHWFLSEIHDIEGFVAKAESVLKAHHMDYTISNTVLISFEKAKAIATENDRIIVFGSFQTVGIILNHYGDSKP